MAIDSDGTTVQYLNYGNIITGVAEKLIMFWVYLDVAQNGQVFPSHDRLGGLFGGHMVIWFWLDRRGDSGLHEGRCV